MGVTTFTTMPQAGLPLTLPTAYVAAITNFATGSLSFENRKDEYNALAAFILSSPALLSLTDIQSKKKSFERPVQIPVIKRVGISLVDGRICNLDGQEASTDMIVITFSVKGFRIKIPKNMLDNNYLGYTQLLADARYHGWHTWYTFMENNSINFLEANKTTSLVPDTFGVYAGAYDGQAGPQYYARLKYLMGRNLLSANGRLLDVSNGASAVTRLLMGMNGPNNAVNQQVLLSNAADQYPTNYLVPTAGYAETHYVFPVGAVGIYHWLSPNAANREVDTPQKDYWWSEKDPMFGYFDASVHFQSKCEDKPIGYGGQSEPVYSDFYEYTVDPSFVKQYSSVVGESPIVKFNLSN